MNRPPWWAVPCAWCGELCGPGDDSDSRRVYPPYHNAVCGCPGLPYCGTCQDGTPQLCTLHPSEPLRGAHRVCERCEDDAADRDSTVEAVRRDNPPGNDGR
jgi:hypothetical protein